MNDLHECDRAYDDRDDDKREEQPKHEPPEDHGGQRDDSNDDADVLDMLYRLLGEEHLPLSLLTSVEEAARGLPTKRWLRATTR